MIVPIWRSWFLFRFKGERTTPESLMGQDSGFVLVTFSSVMPAKAGTPLAFAASKKESCVPAFAGMTFWVVEINHDMELVN